MRKEISILKVKISQLEQQVKEQENDIKTLRRLNSGHMRTISLLYREKETCRVIDNYLGLGSHEMG